MSEPATRHFVLETGDEEINAMRIILSVLENLTEEQQARVLAYVRARVGEKQ